MKNTLSPLRNKAIASSRTVIFAISAACFCFSAGLLPALAEPATTQKAALSSYEQSIAQASKRFAVPASWIRAVIAVESNWNARAVSPAGAIGLMQVMPDTYQELRRQYGLGADPYCPHDNIMAGTAYLKQMHRQFGRQGFLAAYNAGPGRYQKHLKGTALPAETVAYVAKLEPLLNTSIQPRTAAMQQTASREWVAAPLFVTRAPRGKTAGTPSPDKPAANGHLLTALSPRSTGLFASGQSQAD